MGGQNSAVMNISTGVAQGSALHGRLFFLLYINSITSIFQSEIKLFANDKIIYVFDNNSVIAADALNYASENEKVSQLMSWTEIRTTGGEHIMVLVI